MSVPTPGRRIPKTLNVPYDSGLAIVADPVAHRAAFGVNART